MTAISATAEKERKKRINNMISCQTAEAWEMKLQKSFVSLHYQKLSLLLSFLRPIENSLDYQFAYYVTIVIGNYNPIKWEELFVYM